MDTHTYRHRLCGTHCIWSAGMESTKIKKGHLVEVQDSQWIFCLQNCADYIWNNSDYQDPHKQVPNGSSTAIKSVSAQIQERNVHKQ